MKGLWNCRRGVVATELAVILPVLLLFLLGIMEGGRILSAWVILTNEAREAARYGATNDYNVDCAQSGTITAWQSKVKTFATNNVGQMLDTSTGALTVGPTSNGPYLDCSTGIPTSSQVTLTYPMATINPLVHAIWPTATVWATSIMRAE